MATRTAVEPAARSRDRMILPSGGMAPRGPSGGVPVLPGMGAGRQPDPAGKDVHACLPGTLVLGQARAAHHGDDGLAEHLLVAADDGARGAAPAAAPGLFE